MEASVPQTPPHLPADRNHVGGARRRPLQCRQLAAAQISQRPVRLSKGTLGREMLSDLCEHPRGRGLQHPPHGACKDRGRNGPSPLRCQGVAREQFRKLTEREAVHTDHPRRASARRVAMPSRWAPTTTVADASKCPRSTRDASSASHRASNAGGP